MQPITRHHVLCLCACTFLCFCILIICSHDLELRPFLKPVLMVLSDTGSEENNSTLHQGKKYMVYDCSYAHGRECGGWSDRLSGMLSVYVISIMTNQTFLVNHDKPCPLQKFLDFRDHNWIYNQESLKKNNLSHQYLSFFCNVPAAVKSHRMKRLIVTFNRDVNFVRMNWDYTEHFRSMKGTGKVVPWITTLQYADIYKHFFNSLFKLKKEMSDYLDHVRGHKHFACAHIRMGESGMVRTTPAELGDIWRFLKKKEKQKFSIFVATDSNLVKKKARELFSRSLVDIHGVITHIDITTKDDQCAGFRKAILDFFMLTLCEELIITRSGFGIIAAYLRQHHTLHCLTRSGVVRCTRLTIHNIFPTPILSPF